MKTQSINFKTNLTTLEIAGQIFEKLGVSEIENRESSNCPPEFEYFLGKLDAQKIKIQAIDDEEDYSHCITYEGQGSEIRDRLFENTLVFFKTKEILYQCA